MSIRFARLANSTTFHLHGEQNEKMNNVVKGSRTLQDDVEQWSVQKRKFIDELNITKNH